MSLAFFLLLSSSGGRGKSLEKISDQPLGVGTGTDVLEREALKIKQLWGKVKMLQVMDTTQ